MHITKRKKPICKESKLYDSNHMTCWKSPSYEDNKNDQYQMEQ